MSTSPMISKSIVGNRMESDDPYSTLYVENLLGGLNEWRNIQEIVRSTFKALCEVVRSQGIAIRELEKQVSSKASKSELNSGLNIKANVADVMRTFSEVATSIESRPTLEEIQTYLDEKVSKTDLQYYLNSKPNLEEVRHLVETRVSHAELQSEVSSVNLKLDDIHKDFMKKSSTYATSKELGHLQQTLEQKANVNDVNEALGTKASKESVINALHRKANKTETESMLKSKVDLEELQNVVNQLNNKVDFNDFEKLHSICENKAERSDIIQLSNSLNNKAETKDFDLLNVCYQELKRDNAKRIDDLDGDIDRLIENIKKEFQNLNIVINNLDVKKADFKELEKINSGMSKKIDADILNQSISQMKTDLYDTLAHFKNDIHQNKKIYEEHLNEKIQIVEKNQDKTIEEISKCKERLNEIYDTRKSDQDEIIKSSKQIVNNYAKEISAENNLIRSEMQKLNTEMEDLLNRKLDKKEYDMVKNKMFSEIEQKAEIQDLENLFKNIQKELSDRFEDNRVNINQTLKSFENDIQRALEKKANMYELTTILNSKADSASINLQIQNKVGASEFESLKSSFEKMNRELLNKLDYNKFEVYMNDTRNSLEEIQKDLMMKSNIKEILSLMKNKADIDDVNKALTQIHEELDLKCNLEQVKYKIKF